MKFVYSSGSRPLDGYTIKRGIGVGGFGEVYFATSDGGKEVALKRIQRNLDIELRGVRQCLNLKHHNLIDLYDIRYDDEGGAWVLMEYVSGETLKERLDANPNGLRADEAIHWFDGIAQGVAYLHDHGIVHRDLKPGNIFSDAGVVKIGDYGLSKFISCSRRSGQTESVGTFHYMAPEIGKGVYGKQIDVYALGIILHELLTGSVPFEGETSQEIIMKHLTADPDVSALSEPFRSVVRKALHKDPEKRYASVVEMAAQLSVRLEGAGPHKTTQLLFISDGGGGEPASAQRGPDQPDAADAGIADAKTADAKTADAKTADAKTADADAGAGRADAGEVRVSRAADSRNASAPSRESTYFITEEGTGDDMVFGPVRKGQSPQRTRRERAAGSRPNPASSNPASSNPASLRPRGYPLGQLPIVFKILMLVGVAILMVRFSYVLLPAGIVLGSLFLVYFGVRSLASEGASTQQSIRAHSTELRRLRGSLARAMQRKPLSETMSEMTGAMLFSSVACGVMSLLIVGLAGQGLYSQLGTWTMITWLAVVTCLGTWALLAAGKCWECVEGDGATRRFLLLAVGLAVGFGASLSSGFLHASMSSPLPAIEVSPFLASDVWYSGRSAPRLPAYLAYFGGLFAITRWWVQVDPLRSSRLSLVATGMSVLGAGILHTIIYFPQPWGLAIAATISVAAQLSAPWLSPDDRERLRQFSQESISQEASS